MAAAMREHLIEGRTVIVELMTQGEKSGIRAVMAKEGVTLSETQFGEARVKETLDALTRLGVQGVRVHAYPDSKLRVADVSRVVDFWIRRGGTADEGQLSLKGTVGADLDGDTNPDHSAVWDALMQSGYKDVRGYYVYRYAPVRPPVPERRVDPTDVFRYTVAGGRVSRPTSNWCDDKREALEAFAYREPAIGRYGIGLRSAWSGGGLIGAAANDCHEYVWYR